MTFNLSLISTSLFSFPIRFTFFFFFVLFFLNETFEQPPLAVIEKLDKREREREEREREERERENRCLSF